MGIIRGKFEADREIHPKITIFGETDFFQLECGCWIDKRTGEKAEVKTYSLDEFMKEFDRKHDCLSTNPA